MGTDQSRLTTVVGRTQDISAMTDLRLKSWIKDNQIAPMNVRDALCATNEYKDHLRKTESKLSMA